MPNTACGRRCEGLRFVARAITPPGRVRRFDTRFFAAWREDVAVALADGGPTNELEEIVWLPIAEAKQADIPLITKTVLQKPERRLRQDPDLAPGGPVPFYRLVGKSFVDDLLEFLECARSCPNRSTVRRIMRCRLAY